MLKLSLPECSVVDQFQPPSGGCVLKLIWAVRMAMVTNQPPSGGCVLKQYLGRLFLAFLPSRLRAAVC